MSRVKKTRIKDVGVNEINGPSVEERQRGTVGALVGLVQTGEK